MSWLINIFFKDFCKRYICVLFKKWWQLIAQCDSFMKYRSLMTIICSILIDIKMYHLLILNVIRESCVSNMYICSLIVVNSLFVLYLMCCFWWQSFVYGFQTNTNYVLFCSGVRGVYFFCMQKTCILKLLYFLKIFLVHIGTHCPFLPE